MSSQEREFCDVLEDILKIVVSNPLQSLSNIISDSITAMRIIAKLNKVGYTITLKDILSGKSIRDLNLYRLVLHQFPRNLYEKKITEENKRSLSNRTLSLISRILKLKIIIQLIKLQKCNNGLKTTYDRF